MQNFRALGAPPPDPHASGGWGLCPQTPTLRRLGASPPDPQNSPPDCEFLATRLIGAITIKNEEQKKAPCDSYIQSELI